MNDSVVVEVCQRLGDDLRYHAQIKDHSEYWGCGNTIDDAVADLVYHHLKQFSLNISRIIEDEIVNINLIKDIEIVDIGKEYR